MQQVLVDGKPFFGNDPNAALKNLPASAIEKIEVFDRKSDQAKFTGFDDGEEQNRHRPEVMMMTTGNNAPFKIEEEEDHREQTKNNTQQRVLGTTAAEKKGGKAVQIPRLRWIRPRPGDRDPILWHRLQKARPAGFRDLQN